MNRRRLLFGAGLCARVSDLSWRCLQVLPIARLGGARDERCFPAHSAVRQEVAALRDFDPRDRLLRRSVPTGLMQCKQTARWWIPAKPNAAVSFW